MSVRRAKSNARRLAATVQRVEQTPHDFTPDRRMPRPTGMACGKVTATITAMSGTAPGSGTVTLQKFDGTNLADGTGSYTVKSFGSSAIATGKYVFLQPWGGYLWVVTANC